MIAAMNRKILVVDDDSFIRECCVELLTGAGYSVDAAEDGIEAIKRLENGVYDLVISDVTMPRLNGIGLYLKVEQEHPYLANRFLFITGAVPSDSESAALLMRRRASILVKPFEPSALIQKAALLTLLPLSEHFRTPGVDMRRQERIYCFSDCILFTDGSSADGIAAKALDISPNGICVRYPGPPLAMLKKIGLQLKSRSIERRGLIRWSKDSNGFATSGIEIEEPLELSSILETEHRA